MSENIQVVEEGTAHEALFEAVTVGQVEVVAIEEEYVFTKEQLEDGLVQLVFFKYILFLYIFWYMFYTFYYNFSSFTNSIWRIPATCVIFQ